MEQKLSNGSDEYTDYKGKKADPRKHGGIRAATLACVVEMMQRLVFICNGVIFVDYFLKSMHYSIAESSNMVTNFMGTSHLISIVWGFVSDSYITRFNTFIVSAALELMGFIILTYQAQNSHLQPLENKTPSHIQATILYTGIYAIALGVGGTKATLPAHGADQLDPSNQNLISSFFNWYFFSICTGSLLASSVMVWVEDNFGWSISFTISAIVLCFALCTFAAGFSLYRYKTPAGSPLSRIIKVSIVKAPLLEREKSHDKFKFLNGALFDPNIEVAQVEETKSFLGLLPIFATTIMMNCCVAQLMTFSVQQGNIMNRKFHNFIIPTQFLAVFPMVIMLSLIPLFERFRQRDTMNSKIYQPLTRIGVGLAIASMSMAVAATIEAKRLEAIKNDNILSVFWLILQYTLLGLSDTLTVGGMLEFFYSEAPHSMRSICTSLSWCSTSVGFFMSSVLVTISNSISARFGQEWFGGKDLNHDRLDLFYALLCILNIINFLLFVYFAKRY